MIPPLIRENLIEKREFQTNIAENAMESNTLVVLPTAAGKTIIAAFVASHFLYNYRDFKVLMMAPTKPLVQQHRDTFLKVMNVLPEDTEVLTGELDPDYRIHSWQGNRKVYFATPQVVRNDLKFGIDLSKFSLLLFDECHRSKKKYAYTEVADAYIEQSDYPTIMGLTASPGADRKTIEEVCDNLYIERIEARTKEDPDIAPYINDIEVKRKYVKFPENYRSLRKGIRGMLRWRLEKLYKAGLLDKNPKYAYKGDLISAGDDLNYRMELAQLDVETIPLRKHLINWSAALTIWHVLDLLESQGAHSLRRFLEKSGNSGKKSHEYVISEMEERGIRDRIESLDEHPKTKAAVNSVLKKFEEDPSAKAIVFTQYRDTASHINSKFREKGVKSERFVGQANKEGDPGLSQEEQSALLDRLRSGDLKVLVATSVGEEGLDVPSVDLVVFYEPVPSGVRYIQRRGRTGRKGSGEALILATEDTHDIAYLRVSDRRRKNMKKVIRNLNSDLREIENRPEADSKPYPS